jgi:hypothetical protein
VRVATGTIQRHNLFEVVLYKRQSHSKSQQMSCDLIEKMFEKNDISKLMIKSVTTNGQKKDIYFFPQRKIFVVVQISFTLTFFLIIIAVLGIAVDDR